MVKYTVGFRCGAGKGGTEAQGPVMALYIIYNKNVALILQVPSSLIILAPRSPCCGSEGWLFQGNIVDVEKISMPNS